jgi:hypothetical protein
LTASAEIPALVPVGRLNRKSPVIFQIEGVTISTPFNTMALDTLLVDNQLGALLNALFSRLSGFDSSKLKNRLGLRLLVGKLSDP